MSSKYGIGSCQQWRETHQLTLSALSQGTGFLLCPLEGQGCWLHAFVWCRRPDCAAVAYECSLLLLP